jgi:hypothetical protein
MCNNLIRLQKTEVAQFIGSFSQRQIEGMEPSSQDGMTNSLAVRKSSAPADHLRRLRHPNYNWCLMSDEHRS